MRSCNRVKWNVRAASVRNICIPRLLQADFSNKRSIKGSKRGSDDFSNNYILTKGILPKTHVHIDRRVFCWQIAAGDFIRYFTFFHRCRPTSLKKKFFFSFAFFFFNPPCQPRPVGDHFHPSRPFFRHLVSSFQTAAKSHVPFRPLQRLFTPQSIAMRAGGGAGECHASIIRHPAGSFWVGGAVFCSSGKIRPTQEWFYLPTPQISTHLSIYPSTCRFTGDTGTYIGPCDHIVTGKCW